MSMKVHTYHCERCGSDYSFLEAHPNRRRCPECKNVLSILTEKRDVSPGVTWHVQLADGEGMSIPKRPSNSEPPGPRPAIGG